MRERNLTGHVAGDLHDRLVARARLRKLCDQRVAVIVPASTDAGLAPDHARAYCINVEGGAL